MWDYCAEDPVWDARGGLSLESLGLSAGLRSELREWSAALTRVMVAERNGQGLSGGPSLADLNELGQQLAERVQAELGNRFVVAYVKA